MLSLTCRGTGIESCEAAKGKPIDKEYINASILRPQLLQLRRLDACNFDEADATGTVEAQAKNAIHEAKKNRAIYCHAEVGLAKAR